MSGSPRVSVPAAYRYASRVVPLSSILWRFGGGRGVVASRRRRPERPGQVPVSAGSAVGRAARGRAAHPAPQRPGATAEPQAPAHPGRWRRSRAPVQPGRRRSTRLHRGAIPCHPIHQAGLRTRRRTQLHQPGRSTPIPIIPATSRPDRRASVPARGTVRRWPAASGAPSRPPTSVGAGLPGLWATWPPHSAIVPVGHRGDPASACRWAPASVGTDASASPTPMCFCWPRRALSSWWCWRSSRVWRWRDDAPRCRPGPTPPWSVPGQSTPTSSAGRTVPGRQA